MGKYMKKSKITVDVAAMELSQSSMGVRTRAKTLALQRLQNSSSTPNLEDTTSYLQLRNRRLDKSLPQLLTDISNDKHSHKESPKCRASLKLNSGNFSLSCSEKVPVGDLSTKIRVSECKFDEAQQDFHDVSIEGSCGENNLEFEGRERGAQGKVHHVAIQEIATSFKLRDPLHDQDA